MLNFQANYDKILEVLDQVESKNDDFQGVS